MECPNLGRLQMYIGRGCQVRIQPRVDNRSAPPIINLVVYKDREFPALLAARFGVTERFQLGFLPSASEPKKSPAVALVAPPDYGFFGYCK